MSDWHHLIPFSRIHQKGSLGLATLVQVEGSSYRPPGARLLLADDGSFSGLLSGGCLEEGIATMAGEILKTGHRRVIKIDTRPHFGCAGILHILLEPVSYELLQNIAEKIEARETFQISTSLGQGTLIGEGLCADRHVEIVRPIKRLIAIGGTDDMEPVLRIGAVLGWEMHRLVRNHRLLGEMQQVAGETLSMCEPADFKKRFQADEHSAVLIMSHHLATDFAYLKEVFNQPYGYIGLLGSKRRRETLLGELGEFGMLEETPYLDRFHAPAGLAIGNGHPSEIALSIMAQIQHEFQRLDCAGDEENVIHLPKAISA